MTSDELKTLIHYDPLTGIATWRHRDSKLFKSKSSFTRWNKRYAGTPAVTLDGKGYLVMSIFAKRYLVHRLAWLYTHGVWPTIVDHIDGNKTNNRLSNLREVTQQQNHMNQRLSSKNTSGVAGVYLNKRNGSWCAQMKFNGKTYHLGSSKNISDVVALRKAEEKRLGFSERHGSKC